MNKILVLLLTISFMTQSMNISESNNIAKEKKSLTIVDAAYRNDIELFNKLFNENTDVNQKDKNGRTALHYAALHGSRELFHRLVICSNLDVNVQDEDGATPIRAAVCECAMQSVMALLQMGADPNIKDKTGVSAIDEAKQSGYDGMIFLFELFKKEE